MLSFINVCVCVHILDLCKDFALNRIYKATRLTHSIMFSLPYQNIPERVYVHFFFFSSQSPVPRFKLLMILRLVWLKMKLQHFILWIDSLKSTRYFHGAFNIFLWLIKLPRKKIMLHISHFVSWTSWACNTFCVLKKTLVCAQRTQ